MYKSIETWERQYHTLTQQAMSEAKRLGAEQSEVMYTSDVGFSVTVRDGAAETVEQHQETMLVVTVYINHCKGQASTNQMTNTAVRETVAAACRIAKSSQPDAAHALADSELMAIRYPSLDLYHPWLIDVKEAIELAAHCEAEALNLDTLIAQSEGASVHNSASLFSYANTHGFKGHYLTTQHSIDCSVIAKDLRGNMQVGSHYSVSRDFNQLASSAYIAKKAVDEAVGRLGARPIKTCQTPVIFHASVADDLIRCFLQAISGKALYRNASFLVGKQDQLVFPEHLSIQEKPYQPNALGSVPFDAEGVAPQERYLVQNGLLKGHILDSYSARRLKLKSTGNASGIYNIVLSTHVSGLSELLQQMGTGLLVTGVIGQGVNLVTGNYSRGVVGFWIENGVIQYPVEEITVAGNLKTMYQQIVAIGGDIEPNHKIQTGSILIEQMTVAGE